jgi:peptidoglycan/xylan/chitin deacetylase (PgdA/CDA1 family)/GT2 family glycosyltransferase/SAM-dependent methyltransferase
VTPRVSFVVPAFEAAATLARSLGSIADQRERRWEAVVIDDGSTDATAEIAAAWAARDARFRLVRQDHAGAAAARNAGIAVARGEWLVFLDADDTIDRRYLTAMLAAAQREAGAEAICCGYLRLTADGVETVRYAAPRLDHDPLAQLVDRCAAVIHAIMVRRARVADAGGFDPGLATNEDWDLWLRLARAGMRFAVVSQCLAHYWNSPTSLTKAGVQMLKDSATVRARARGPGRAVDSETADSEAFAALLWNAGAAIGAGQSWADFIQAVDPAKPLPDDKDHLVAGLFEGLMLGAQQPYPTLIHAWDDFAVDLSAFLDALDAWLGVPGYGYSLLKAVERNVIRAGRFGGMLVLTATAGATLSPRVLIDGIECPEDDIDSVVLKVRWARPASWFLFTVPAWDGQVSGRAVRRAVARQAGARIWRAVLRFGRLRAAALRLGRAVALARRVPRRLAGRSDAPPPAPAPAPASAEARLIAAEREAVAGLGIDTPATRSEGDADEMVEPGGGSGEDWDRFYATEDPWNYASAYEQLKYVRTLEVVPERVPRALELACAEGRFTTMLAPRADILRAVDISAVAIERARQRCAQFGNIEFGTQDFFRQPIEGLWDLIVCSEVLYYAGDEETLRQLAGHFRDHLAPGGHFEHAHAYQLSDDPGRTGFDWGDPYGAQTIFEAFRDAEGLQHVRTVETELYRIDLFRRAEAGVAAPTPIETRLTLDTALEDSVAGCVVWGGAVVSRADVEEERAYEIPVLMYHRIADDGPAALAPYRIAPADFDHQLRFLRRRGFRSVTPDEWDGAARRGAAMRGRPILLTFDDGYRDFAETAWPILKRNGFSAHVFVVTDRVGGSADWDAAFGPPAPLMTWAQIAALAAEGATFGSHLASHQAADTLGSDALLREAARSRAALERALGGAVTTVCPPYGVTDERVEEICAIAGYRRLFTIEEEVAPVSGSRLAVPRLHVLGGEDIHAFAEKLGLADDEPPEPADDPATWKAAGAP